MRETSTALQAATVTSTALRETSTRELSTREPNTEVSILILRARACIGRVAPRAPTASNASIAPKTGKTATADDHLAPHNGRWRGLRRAKVLGLTARRTDTCRRRRIRHTRRRTFIVLVVYDPKHQRIVDDGHQSAKHPANSAREKQ